MEKVKSILNHLYAKFSKTDYQYKFSRDQGLIIHGFLLIKIIEDISYAFDHDTVSISEYYFDSMSDFNCDELNQVLKISIAYFNDHKFNDYIELFEYVRSIQKKITSLDPECGTMKI